MENLTTEFSKSPFIVSEPVSGNNFFDREDLFIQIKDFVVSETKNIFLIHGQRRIGKTSLLRKLFETANKEWSAAPVFFSLQGQAQEQISDLIVEIAKSIRDNLKNNQNNSENSFADISDFYKIFIPAIVKELNNKKLILLFDEFDTIGAVEASTDGNHKNMAYNAFIPFLEKMIEFLQLQRIQVKLIIACGRNYKDLEENRYGQLFKFAQQAELYIFDRQQTERLIAKANVHIPFIDSAVDAVFHITGGHPMFTQCVCDAAFRFAEKNKLPAITPEIVNNITEEVVKQNASAVLWIWHSLPNKAKIILFLAAHQIANEISFNRNSIIQKNKQWNLLPSIDNLDDMLNLLLCNRFIKHFDESENYIFNVEFIRKWILLEVNRESLNTLISTKDNESTNQSVQPHRSVSEQMRKYFLITKENELIYATPKIHNIPPFRLVYIEGVADNSFKLGEDTTVNLSPFYMAEFIVTQELYKAVTGKNPSYFLENGSKRPVEQVNWYDSIRFCAWLNKELEKLGADKFRPLENLPDFKNLADLKDMNLDKLQLNPTNPGFRLPTEAEWEYAARGGIVGTRHGVSQQAHGVSPQTKYAGSNDINQVGWYRVNSGGETKPVGLKSPNVCGLYDMTGNVWEWCWDWYSNYEKGLYTNRIEANVHLERIVRGGSWHYHAGYCNVTARYYWAPNQNVNDLGFRVVFVPLF